MGSLSFGVVKFWGHQVLQLSRFGVVKIQSQISGSLSFWVVKFWGRQVLESSFGVIEFWGC